MSGRVQCRFSEDPPCTRGHFPGHPIVPGAFLLDEVIRALVLALRLTPGTVIVEAAKFASPVGPGQCVELDYEETGRAGRRVEDVRGDERVRGSEDFRGGGDDRGAIEGREDGGYRGVANGRRDGEGSGGDESRNGGKGRGVKFRGQVDGRAVISGSLRFR